MKLRYKILIFVVLLFVGLRLIIAEVALKQLNNYLAGFSESYSLHVDNLALSFLRGAYRLEGFKGELKKDKSQFLKTNYIDISLAWRDLIRGRLQSDIVVDGLNVVLTQKLIQETKSRPKDAAKEAEEAGAKVFPVRLARIDIKNSSLQVEDLNGLPPELRLRITEIDGRLSNATVTETQPISLLRLKGTLQDSATMYVVGELNQLKAPNEWHVAVETKQFELTKLNPVLKRVGPITFTSGKLDLFFEGKGENNQVKGYVKPIVKDLKMVGNRSDFTGFKNFGLEISAAAADSLLEDRDDKTVATKVYFAYGEKGLEWSATQALSKAIQHGYRSTIDPGIENEFKMSGKE